MKKALITGITGQDGSYLAELLLSKGYEVHGLIRRSSTFNTARIDHMYVDPPHAGCKTVPSLRRSQRRGGAFGHSSRTDTPGRGLQPRSAVTCTGKFRRARTYRRHDGNRVDQVARSSPDGWSRMQVLPGVQFRDVRCDTASAGRADSLLSAIAVRCGEGVLVLDHQELPRGVRDLCRERNSVQPRISAARRNIRNSQDHASGGADQAGLENDLYMGNLDAIRDWGYAPEYVEGMWRMLQADEPDDYVLATGGNYSVKDFLTVAFEHAGLNWEDHVRFDERYLRPTEVDALIGDAGKAEQKLGWKATVHTPELARIMVDADIEALKCEGKPWIDRPNLVDWEHAR